jgi:hypothetical protein
MSVRKSIFIGWDPREIDAYRVAWRSIVGNSVGCPVIHPLMLSQMRALNYYRRPTERRGGQLWDNISQAPMSTEFAISRFLTPILAQDGWALFMDCDVMARVDIGRLFACRDERFAVQVVKHEHQGEVGPKMDGQIQTAYPRKNWSSVMLFNCAHPGNDRLTVEMINTRPGRDLHRFCWLEDDEIGELPAVWNHLVGVDSPDPDAKLVHFTLGIPSMAGYEDCEFADEWRKFL